MADVYRLPEALGGGEFEALEFSNTPGGMVALMVGNHVAFVAKGLLTKVEPLLPPPPPPGSVVRVGSLFAERVHDFDPAKDDSDFWRASDGTWRSWEDLCRLGTPVRLVPDPAVGVELPWRGQRVGSGGLSALAVGDWGSAETMNPGLIPLTVTSGGRRLGAVLTPHTAREMAAALWAAADAAEAGAP